MLYLEPEIIEKLLPLLPLRVVIRRDEFDQILGLTENSFSMGWEKDHIVIFWSGKYYSNLGTTGTIDAVVGAEYNFNLYKNKYRGVTILDPTAPNCPIRIDWDRWLNAKTKYDKRNAHFEVVVNSNWSNYVI